MERRGGGGGGGGGGGTPRRLLSIAPENSRPVAVLGPFHIGIIQCVVRLLLLLRLLRLVASGAYPSGSENLWRGR